MKGAVRDMDSESSSEEEEEEEEEMIVTKKGQSPTAPKKYDTRDHLKYHICSINHVSLINEMTSLFSPLSRRSNGLMEFLRVRCSLDPISHKMFGIELNIDIYYGNAATHEKFMFYWIILKVNYGLNPLLHSV